MVGYLIKTFSFFLSVLLFAACQTAYKGADDGSDMGVWEGKVRMLDSKKDKKIWGFVTWISESQKSRLRIDVKATLDVPIATFIMQENSAQLWLYQEDKYYTSNDPQKLFAKLTRLQVDPQVFFAILSRHSRLKKPWQCRSQDAAVNCNNQQQKLSLEIQNQDENTRRVTLRNGTKYLNLHLVRSKVEVNDRMFMYRPTSQFERISI